MRRWWAILVFFWLLPAQAAPELLLAKVWDSAADPAPYWVSEKLDGVRAFWDGHALWTRQGRKIAAPDWFVAGFPKQALDGELWMGRGRFGETSAAVRRAVPEDAEWRQIRFMLFELPDGAGDFTRRIQTLEALTTAAAVPWLKPVAQFRVNTAAELQARLESVVAEGGEGLMLHRADAVYVSGRAPVLFKYKPWFDAEARVVAHLPGSGQFAGQLGALEVEVLKVEVLDQPQGLRFRIGSGFSEAERQSPPPLGSVITYRYTSLNPSGIPRFPIFVRVRGAD